MLFYFKNQFNNFEEIFDNLSNLAGEEEFEPGLNKSVTLVTIVNLATTVTKFTPTLHYMNVFQVTGLLLAAVYNLFY